MKQASDRSRRTTQSNIYPLRRYQEQNHNCRPMSRLTYTGFQSPVTLAGESPDNLARLVAAVVETESPVHIELVIERIREHYALGRAGRLVREAVQASVRAWRSELD